MFARNQAPGRYPNTPGIVFNPDKRLYVTKSNILESYNYSNEKYKTAKSNKRDKNSIKGDFFGGTLHEFALQNSFIDAGIETTLVNTNINQENTDEGYDSTVNGKYRTSIKGMGCASSKYVLISANEHNEYGALKSKSQNKPDVLICLRVNFEKDGICNNMSHLRDELASGNIQEILEYNFVFDLLGFLFTNKDIHYTLSKNCIMPAKSMMGTNLINNANYFVKSSQLYYGLDNLFELLKS